MKRGQISIITAVLFILLTLSAIVIIWNAIYFLIKGSSEDINIDNFKTKLNIKSFETSLFNDAHIKVKRDSGDELITELKFIFYDKDDKTYSVSKTNPDLEHLDTKSYYFTSDEIEANKELIRVSVTPVFGERIGIPVSKSVDNNQGVLPGLISWWKFEGNAEDSIGDNHGTLYGSAEITNGELVIIDNDDVDEMRVGDYDMEITDGDFTMSAWVKLNEIDNEKHPVIDFQPLGNGHCILYHNPNDGWEFRHRPPEGDYSLIVSEREVTTEKDKWYHLVLMKGGDDWKIYRNSEILTSGTSSLPMLKGNDLVIGHDTDSHPNYYSIDGSIDNVMIFNRALSEEEIEIIYNTQLT